VIRLFDTPELLISGLADFVVETASRSIQERGRFNFVLSGGSSPKRLYELLASEAYREKIDWHNVYFFFGDERNVPSDHPDSNYLMVKKALFDPLKINESHQFPIDTSLSPAQAAYDYERGIRNHFSNEPAKFDLILLGLGDNSHTASLFPHTTVIYEKTALIKDVYVPEVNMYRITFTAPLINAAHAIAFLVYGASKADAVHHILEGEKNFDTYPAQLIESENLIWFMDREASKKVKSEK
jgi:6-phosphogluconolactonase